MNKIKKLNDYILFRDTPWDTKILGINSNEIVEMFYTDVDQLKSMLTEFEELCKDKSIQFTNCRCTASDFNLRRILSKYDYYFTELSYEVNAMLTNIDLIDYDEIELFERPKIDQETVYQIRDLATDNFEYGRFFEDSIIDIEMARERNKNWVNQLITDQSRLLFSKKNSDLIGFMFYVESDSTVQFTLGGINPKYSHLAVVFWKNLFKYFKISNKRFIKSLISASNISVLNLYTHFNFKVTHAYAGYHKFRGPQ